MLGNPKYNYDDIVSFKIKTEDDVEHTLTGKVYIIDRYGTFEQNEEVSYDIMVDDWGGQPCLFKHIRESHLIKL